MFDDLINLHRAMRGEPSRDSKLVELGFHEISARLSNMLDLGVAREQLSRTNSSLAADLLAQSVDAVNRLSAFIQELINAGDLDEALTVAAYVDEMTCEELGQEDPLHIEAILMHGQLLTELERWFDAERVLHGGLKLAHQVFNERSGQAGVFHDALGTLAYRQNRFDVALASFRESVALLLPLNQPQELLSSIVNQGRAERALGDYHAARQSLEAALRLQLTIEPAPADLANRYSELGSVLAELGDFTSAEKLIRDALQIRLASKLTSREVMATSYHNLSRALEHLGRSDEAETNRQEMAKWLNPDHRHYVAIQNERAVYLLEERRLEEAHKLLTPLIRLAAVRHGRNSLPFADVCESWGRLCYQRDQLPAAERAFRRSTNIRRGVVGENHIDTLRIEMELAQVLLKRGDLTQAEHVLAALEPPVTRAVGAEHLAVGELKSIQGELHLQQGKVAEAASAFQVALDIRTRGLGEKHLKTALAMNNLAVALFGQQRFEEAENLWRSALDTIEVERGASHAYAVVVNGNLANVCMVQNRAAEAEERFASCDQWYRERDETRTLNYVKLLNSWACLQIVASREMAQLTFRRALAIVEDCFGNEHVLVGIVCHNLAACQAGLGKKSEAEISLVRSQEVFTRNLGADHPDTMDVNRKLEALRAAPADVLQTFKPILTLLAA